MASRLGGFKLKSSSSKKKTGSPNGSRSSTPTNSQSSMPSAADKPELIDEPLQGEQIESLKIKEEELRKHHPQRPQKQEPTLQQILVKHTPSSPSQKRPSTRSVAVLHPFPHGAKPSKTKILGSVKAGPRYDKDDVFVDHSILGTIEGYANSRTEDRQLSTVSGLSQIPPIVLPQLPKKLPEKQQPLAPPRETNALANWDKRMEERRNLQEKIAKRIRGSSEALTMNHGDFYRRIQEERSVIDQAIPAIDKGKGFYVGSEFWRPQVTIGDDLTGIRTTLTKTEKGYPSDVEFVSIPHALKDKGKSSRWANSEYLHQRKGELVQIISELQHHYPPDISSLCVTGHNSHPSKMSFPRPLSLDSLGESSLSGDDTDDDDTSLRQSTSILGSHPDVVAPPMIGPGLQMNGRLLKWEETSDTFEENERRVEMRVLFEAEVQESHKSEIILENCGTVAINFSWKRIRKANPLGTQLAEQSQRFYFDTKGGVILPGKQMSLQFIFKSSTIGIYSECWGFETRPVLCGGKPVLVTLRGVAFQQDLQQTKRDEIEHKLTNKIIEASARRIVEKIVTTIKTPPRVQSPLPTTTPEETEFLLKNPKVFYQYNIVQQLKAMYLQILSPSTSDQSETDPSSKPGGKKLEDKGKKEKSGKEKKDAGKTGKTTDNTKEEADVPPPDLNIPPWDLSLESLEKLVLTIEDADQREEKMMSLNNAISALTLPPPQIPNSTNYIKIYSLLCEAVDQIVSTADHLRQVMGLPLRDIGVQDEGSIAELEQPPSQPCSPAHGGKKEQAKKGGKTKDKERPPSKKGASKVGKKTSVKSVKQAQPSKAPSPEPEQGKESTMPTPKPPEIDPTLNEKYKQNLYSMAHHILVSTVEQMAALMTV